MRLHFSDNYTTTTPIDSSAFSKVEASPNTKYHPICTPTKTKKMENLATLSVTN
jgi:hypothetical protein